MSINGWNAITPKKNYISLLFMDEIKHGYHEYPIIHKLMKCHHTNRIIISNEIFNANEWMYLAWIKSCSYTWNLLHISFGHMEIYPKWNCVYHGLDQPNGWNEITWTNFDNMNYIEINVKDNKSITLMTQMSHRLWLIVFMIYIILIKLTTWMLNNITRKITFMNENDFFPYMVLAIVKCTYV